MTLRPDQPRGRALLAYIIEPFLAGQAASSHTHYAESLLMAEVLLELGYQLDVISYRNTTFSPKRRYDLFISARTNFERLAARLNPDCLKIVHLDTSHWLTNNAAATQRCLELQRRRGVSLDSYRELEHSWALEAADGATLLGNRVTFESYRYAGKPIVQLPVPVAHDYPAPSGKDFTACRRHFLWLGSRGLVHKGLDLVLEAFSELPEFQLTICGPLAQEPRFSAAFARELSLPNVHVRGWIDVASPEFAALAASALAIVYPSCAEGCAGSVAVAMRAGLIPIASAASGIDIPPEAGRILPELSAAAIKRAVCELASLPEAQLQAMALASWQLARTRFSPARYRAIFRQAIARFTSGAALPPGLIDEAVAEVP